MPRTTAWPPPPDLQRADRLVWAETVHGGGCTSIVLEAGTTVRLTDLDGDACAHLLVFGAADPVRLRRAPDPTSGRLLRSGQGEPLATITHDSAGRHDEFGGALDLTQFPRAAAKHDLGRRPLPPSVSFFQAVTRDDDGAPRFRGSAGPGANLSIRAEIPLVLLVANTVHPLDPRPDPPCGPLELLAWRA
jgi:uncharacterized protein YcgI (DUF1989 family)